MTRRQIAGGGVQHVRQCMNCGARVGNAVKAGTITEAIYAFDEDFRVRKEEECRVMRESRRQAMRDAEADQSKAWWDDYDAFMQSDEWREIRLRVLHRDKRICQSCLTEPATQVHHLSYNRLGEGRSVADVPAWDLAAICTTCHQRIHPHRTILNKGYEPWHNN
jgi:5-methylcytosine-specific restriction endonuclease McrA